MNSKTLKLWQTCLLSAVLLGLNQPAPSLATEAPPEGSVKIIDFAAGGTGCPQGSYDYIISKDRSTIEIIFDKFNAELDIDTKKTAFQPQSNCTVSFNLEYPAGYSVSWDRVEHRGFIDTSGGANAELRSRYYIPGTGGFDVTRVYQFPSNSVLDYTVVQDNIASAFTACGATVPLSVNTRVRLYGTPTDYNALTVDSLTNKVKTILYLNWRRC